MYKRVLIIAAVVVALGAAWMQAQKADASAAKTLNAIIVASSVPSPSKGACAAEGYAAICPSDPTGAKCECISDASGVLSGNFGKGKAVLLLTEDPDSATTDVAGENCIPFFGTIALTGTTGSGKKEKTQTATVNVVGANCDPFNAKANETLSGGFGVAAAPSPSPAITGWGNLTGTVNTKDDLKMTLKGPIS